MEAIIYTTPTCKYCKPSKAYLTRKGIPYTEKDASDPEVAKEAFSLSQALTVPVILLKNGRKRRVLVGYDLGRYNKAVSELES